METAISVLADSAFPPSTGLLLAVGSASAAAGVALILRRFLRLPPGPWGVPLLGCWQLRDQSQWHISLTDLAPKFPGIFSFRCGCKLVIVLTKYHLVKEMLESNMFSGREKILQKITKNRGVVVSEGEVWKLHRRTGLRVLRDFGFARPKSAEMVENAMVNVRVELDSACEEQREVQVRNLFLTVSNSVIAQLLFGRVFSIAEPDFAEFCQNVRKTVLSDPLTLISQYPLLGALAVLLPLPQRLQELANKMNGYIASIIEERRVEFDSAKQDPACLCDAYLLQQRSNPSCDTYSKEQIIQVCLEFFIAGTDTTARTVEWAMIYLAFNTEAQQLLHDEMDKVVGSSRDIRLSDRTQLHYLCAVIDECYRLGSIVAIGLFHRALHDTEFHGFHIPQDAVIMPHVYAVHHDPQLWEKPNEFRPERFLDSNGRYKSSPHLIPFLIGKRACIGESLARMEVFLIISLIMQRYEVKPTEDTNRRKEEILRGKTGFLFEPGHYALLFNRR